MISISHEMLCDVFEMLKRFEWCGIADFQLYKIPKCKICGGLKDDSPRDKIQAGHKPDCKLNAMLVMLEDIDNDS